MSNRTFIFCDICNPQVIRPIEFRRSRRNDKPTGRRLCDGKVWFKGNLAEAIDNAGGALMKMFSRFAPVCQNREN